VWDRFAIRLFKTTFDLSEKIETLRRPEGLGWREQSQVFVVVFSSPI